MPRKYSPERRLEAVALARLTGAEAAAKQLGIDVRTVRGWQAAAGDQPELTAPGDKLQAIFDAATAKVMTALATGKLSVRDAAVVAGIAKRNLDKPRPETPEKSREEQWGDEQVRRLDELYGDRADDALDLAIRMLDDALLAGTPPDEDPSDVIFASAVDLDALRAEIEERRRQRFTEAERRALIARAERFLRETDDAVA